MHELTAHFHRIGKVKKKWNRKFGKIATRMDGNDRNNNPTNMLVGVE
jgi:hypothetical protein